MSPLIFLTLLAYPAAPASGDAVGSASYERDVKPLLARRCYACHGALKQHAKLRLDTADLMKKGGRSGPAVEPGEADESLIVEMLLGANGKRMPPEGEPLSPDQISHIKSWIDDGARASAETPLEDPKRHWAFVPPVRPEVPTVRRPDWIRNPIDAFISVEHDRLGLKPVLEADKLELLRRVYVDLIGLAPSRDEITAYLTDESVDAYDRVVERLLRSPRHGERWGRHWMDVWRYSDWAGYGAEVRESKPHVWRWRDWIVESLNSDKGYDRMIMEMLAGDEVAPDDADTVRATGYLARNWYKFNRNVWVQNIVDHTAKAFLGVTMNCARCHDHKYDPIDQTDYYRLMAYFEPHDIRIDLLPGEPDESKAGIARAFDSRFDEKTYRFIRGDEKQLDKERALDPGLTSILGPPAEIRPISLRPVTFYPGLRSDYRRALLEKADRRIKAAAVESAGHQGKGRPDLDAELSAARWERESLQARIDADDAKYAAPREAIEIDRRSLLASQAEREFARAESELAVAKAQKALDEARASGKKTTYLEAKLVAAKSGRDAQRVKLGEISRTYSPLTPVHPSRSSGRRLALARSIASRENPLTARVMVNQIWMRHFGRPLVETVFDFGSNGKRPSHPGLLDWLASEFMDSGWSMKAVHRLIVKSSTYRMRSWGDPGSSGTTLDPGNAVYWRMNPRRMEAESVRDNVLRVGGSLDSRLGGPEIDQALGLTSSRRSIYFRHAPEKQMTFLKLFDAANMTACYRRDETVAPQQALALVNSTLALSEARRLANRLGNLDDLALIDRLFLEILSRRPTGEEIRLCRDFLSNQSRLFRKTGGLTTVTDGPTATVAASADPSMRARENLTHVLINHNDFVTVR